MPIINNIFGCDAIVVCNPPCVNGACVKNDTCSCSAGYEGETCETPCEKIVCFYILYFSF